MYGFAVLYFMFHVIVRYPTFIDALRDLDDALSMVFLYATFPQTSIIKVCCVCAPELPSLCACTVLVPIFYSCSRSYFSVLVLISLLSIRLMSQTLAEDCLLSFCIMWLRVMH